jgi:ankyrin repeat protein
MKLFLLALFLPLLMVSLASGYNYGGYTPYSYYRPQEAQPIISIDMDSQHLINASLRIAARENRLSDVVELLKKGADINSVSDNGRTALMFASENCMVSVARTLIQQNANINLTDHDGDSALVYATLESCLPVVKLLLSRKDLEINQRDGAGKTVLDYATDCASIDVDGQASKILYLLHRRTHH